MKKNTFAMVLAAGAATGAYLAAVCPRIENKPDMTAFTGKVFAHRGMYGGKILENSMEAFKKAADNGYGIEFDVQLSADGQAVVFHDYSLLRIHGDSRLVKDLTVEELKEFGIPTLKEVTDMIDGRVPLIIELKGETKDISVCPISAQILDEYSGEYCIESFNPYILKWFKDCRPEVVRGQLSSCFIADGKRNPKYFFVENLLTNCMTKPDFIAYNHKYPFKLSLAVCRKVYKIPVIGWTVRTASEWGKCADRFDSYICEGLPKKKTNN